MANIASFVKLAYYSYNIYVQAYTWSAIFENDAKSENKTIFNRRTDKNPCTSDMAYICTCCNSDTDQSVLEISKGLNYYSSV